MIASVHEWPFDVLPTSISLRSAPTLKPNTDSGVGTCAVAAPAKLALRQRAAKIGRIFEGQKWGPTMQADDFISRRAVIAGAVATAGAALIEKIPSQGKPGNTAPVAPAAPAIPAH